jgi:hypothetical protein
MGIYYFASIRSKPTAWLAGTRIGTAEPPVLNNVKNWFCGRVPPWAQHKNQTAFAVDFLVVPRAQTNCFICVEARKSGVCFVSIQNDEEREARNFCDDKNLLVEEIPAPGTYRIKQNHSRYKAMSGTNR